MSTASEHQTLEGVVIPLRAGQDDAPQQEENPAGWLARQQARDLPELGPWLPTRAHARQTAAWAAQWGWWHARFHARRSPRYLARLLGRCARAGGRGVRWWAVWVYAPEQAAQVKAVRHQMRVITRETRQTKNGQAAREAALTLRGMELQLDAARKRLHGWRAAKLASTALLAGGALAGLDGAAVAVGGWVYPAAGLLAVTIGALTGRREQEAPLVDAGAPAPVRVDLRPDQLNAAFRAAGLLKGEDASLALSGLGISRLGKGWCAVVDLPRGGGKTAADAIAKRNTLAAELGVDEIQLIMQRVRAAAGGHAGRLSIWVADDDPYLGKPTPSQLIEAEAFDFWKPVPFGRDAQGNRIEVGLLWQSAFFGGLPRRGKTFSMRLLIAAAALDGWARLYLADGKGGADFRAVAQIAHRYVQGADESKGDLEAFEAMLDELISEMTRRFALFATLPTSMCPEGKLTPEIMRAYGLPLILIAIDELQEYLEALESDKDRARVIGKMARIARRGPAAGFIPVYASQRPDAKSVPTKLREIVSYRYCTQVTDKTSSDMVLGDGKANQGADASALSEEHVGVGVLVTGPASHVTVKADLMDNVAFERVCQRGRVLREKAGTLSGHATGDLQTAGAAGFVIPPIVADVLEVMGQRTRIWTEDLLSGLANLDEDTYGDYDAGQLAAELEAAGVKRSSKQVRIGDANRAGYYRRDVEGVIPADLLTRTVEGSPSTPAADPATA
ncbi:FtsK/SpoIIIE domain-containing protein [Acrocarpospora catenulata]|uniref:FtsK/SpoIIIE domain-containing protein n=1 Tax=Acrocarpospora catenulata TaxID=2836182 RepID=UPI001BD9CD2B|nr:FtsK/SpoIIIE domain-containing protein [Acrocarpospora catenulata]